MAGERCGDEVTVVLWRGQYRNDAPLDTLRRWERVFWPIRNPRIEGSAADWYVVAEVDAFDGACVALTEERGS